MSSATDPRRTRIGGDGLDALGIAISETIADFERLAGELIDDDPAAGEIRICLRSLDPLIDRHGLERTFRFLHLLRARTRSVNGMAHAHLAAPLDSERVRTLEGVTDATIEVGLDGSDPVHRWHLRNPAVTTGWLQLSAPHD